jgi:hypothetical protein
MRAHALAALLVLGAGLGAAGPAAALEACSLLTLVEVSAAARVPVTQDRPHTVRRNGVVVGGDCSYRSPVNRSIVITVHVDGYPGGHQRTAFDRGRQGPHVTSVAGLGDLAYVEAPPGRPARVTFLKGDVLVWVIAQGLGAPEVTQLARHAAGRLPASASGPSGSPAPPTTTTPPPSQQAAPKGSSAAVAPSAPSSGSSGGPDRALVGTWKFEGTAADMLWVVRADGSYRVHGWGVQLPQRGRFEGARGKWSASASNWQDSGSYELAGDTWRVTGKLGTGVWKRVWQPGQPAQNGPGHGGVCQLLQPGEVSLLLDSAVVDPEGIGARHQGTNEALEGCRYTSRLNGNDRVEISVKGGSTIAKSFEQDKRAARAIVPVSGVGLDAYAVMSKNVLTLKALTPTRIMSVALYLTPGVTSDDLPGLTQVARAAQGRVR